jgi:ELWxxDGT repeat protein
MPRLIFETYEVDNVNGGNFQGESVDWQLGTSDGTVGNGSVVDNINTTLDSDWLFNSSDPHYFTQLGTKVLFEANDGSHGIQLWITDGTQAGTQMVKDIGTGSNNGFAPQSTPFNPSSQEQIITDQPVVVGGEMYFQADDGNGFNELWKSDGTSAGTVLVKSFNSDTTASLPDYMVNFNGELYFVANGLPGFVEGTSAGGPQIWKSDGTTAGTVQVTDIAPSNTPDPSDGPAGPFALSVAGNNLFFVWYNGNDNDLTSHEQQLYVVNSANPSGLKLTTRSVGGAQNLTNANGELYFTMNDGTHGDELWKSDGTVAGTQLVDDINPNGNSNNEGADPTDLTYFNGDLYFFATDGTHGTQLWKTDGTQNGTVAVTNINASSGGLSNDGQLTAVGNTLYFVANDGLGDLTQLWKTDGTTGGTAMVTDLSESGDGFDPSELTDIGGTLYFGVNLPSGNGTGNQLWKSDGTAAGTVEITDLYNYRNGFSQISFIPTTPLNDFNGDGTSDLLWVNGSTFTEWQSTGNGFNLNVDVGSVGAGWSLAGTGDFNGDGKSDLLWQNGTTFSEWQSTGNGFNLNVDVGSVGAGWSLAGTGDFNGDGMSDLIWQNGTTFTEWQSTGNGFTPNVYVGSVGAGWSLVGVGDFTGNGMDDLLWENGGTFTVWQSTGNGFTPNVYVGSLGPGWSVAAVGDFNSDGMDDILFRNTNGTFTEWQSTGNGFTPNVLVNSSAGTAWTLEYSPTGALSGTGGASSGVALGHKGS